MSPKNSNIVYLKCAYCNKSFKRKHYRKVYSNAYCRKRCEVLLRDKVQRNKFWTTMNTELINSDYGGYRAGEEITLVDLKQIEDIF